MSEHAATIRRSLETTDARDRQALAPLLSPELVYETEQTRERHVAVRRWWPEPCEPPADRAQLTERL